MGAAVRPGSATRWVAAAAGLGLLGGRIAKRHGLIGELLLVGPPRFVPASLTTVVWGKTLSGPLLIDAALLALAPAVAGGDAVAGQVGLCERPDRLVGANRDRGPRGSRA